MIRLENISLRRGAKLLLDGASVQVDSGERVGLVGRNGCGKSSLFALLAGQLHEDAGQLQLPEGWRIAQIAQRMPQTEQGATDFVLAGDTRLTQLQQELEAVQRSDNGMAIARVHAALADAGAHDARARAQALLHGIGFGSDKLEQPVNRFSGGWRMRLQLARALMAPSELLLLDEPTNHLDLDAMLWLEGWLRRYAGTLIVISHDREFLDAITGTTVHIAGLQLHRYRGNYSAFETQHAQRLRLQQGQHKRQQQRATQLQRFITRFGAKASKARQAQSRLKALQRMEQVAPVLAETSLEIDFAEPGHLPNPMLVLEDGLLGYAGAEGATALPILRKVRLTLLARQRMGILGANGQGKSTLIKTLTGELPLLDGRLTPGKGLRVGYFAQRELDLLRADDNPLQHMLALARTHPPEDPVQAREQSLRNFLGRFGFPGDMVDQPVGQMSGGEQARLALAMVVWQRPNLLLLDEPTNHLDLDTRQALAVALAAYEGSLLLVSHDRALLRMVCDEFLLVRDGRLQPFDGDLEDYRQLVLGKPGSAAPDPAPGSAGSPGSEPAASAEDAAGQNPAQRRRQVARQRQELARRTAPARRRLGQVEQRMAALEQEAEQLQQHLLQPLPPPELAEAGRRLKHLQQESAHLEDEWLQLSETIENLQQTDAAQAR